MVLERIAIGLCALLVMSLPVVAGAYYVDDVSPGLAALAKARRQLPPSCRSLDHRLHQALMHYHPLDSFKTTRADREAGIRLCADGAIEEGTFELKTALQDLGFQSGI